MENRNCFYCNTSFIPNKYSPRQKVCSNPECQKKRQMESMKVWRAKNPNYFKYDESKMPGWLESQRNRSKLWREKNPDKVKAYRQSHHEEYRNYMREYMRKYRQTKAGDEPAAPQDLPGVNPNPEGPEQVSR
ncbi:MAG: hypothetical protein AUJ72_00945 [Candidatus Omnitrophica bacterium CG1_02_46_14]|nr:MAG: hypothetical protein AUJ72_00945 [Candidatus Omnitrophica bacterium CG1_02_46_14]